MNSYIAQNLNNRICFALHPSQPFSIGSQDAAEIFLLSEGRTSSWKDSLIQAPRALGSSNESRKDPSFSNVWEGKRFTWTEASLRTQLSIWWGVCKCRLDNRRLEEKHFQQLVNGRWHKQQLHIKEYAGKQGAGAFCLVGQLQCGLHSRIRSFLLLNFFKFCGVRINRTRYWLIGDDVFKFHLETRNIFSNSFNN